MFQTQPHPRSHWTEIRRNRYRQYLLPTGKDGKDVSYPSVTTIGAYAAAPGEGLDRWRMTRLARGLVDRPDLARQLMDLPEGDKKIYRLTSLAEEAGRGEETESPGASVQEVVSSLWDAGNGDLAADRGTTVHSAFEAWQLINCVSDDPRVAASIMATMACLEAAGLDPLPEMSERVLCNPTQRYAGRIDTALRDRATGKLYAGDVKTGSTRDGHKFAVQLGMYANAPLIWNQETDSMDLAPELDKEVAYVIHVPWGEARASLLRVDIRSGWDEGARAALAAYHWNKRKSIVTPVELDPVSTSVTYQDLVRVWQAGPQSDALLERIKARKLVLGIA